MTVITKPNNLLIPQIRDFIERGKTVTFRVKGNSMRVFVENERDIVLLEPCKRVKLHDVVLAEVEPEVYVLHRIIAINDEHITLQGDGNVRGTEHCQTKDIIGRAAAFYRKGRTVADSTDGWKWKIYSAIWLALTPARRYLLAIYRRIWLRVFPIKIHAK